jgi:hypothetical protein
LLGDGKVLFAGGNNSSGSIACPGYLPDCNTVTSAELYDPSTGVFTLTGSMQASRFDHTATLMSNGEVLIAGGDYIDPIPNPPGPPQFYTFSRSEAEVYNPATGTFTITGYMNVARANQLAMLLPSGKVLVATGAGTPTAEFYDPSSGTFTLSAANLNDERDTGAQAVLLDSGLLLVLAGERNYGVSRPIFWNTAELFDATTPNFTFSVTPASWNVNLGEPASFVVTVAPTNGFAGNVSLSAPPPSEATATLSTNTIPNGSGTSIFTVTPTTTNTPGDFNYYAGVTATSGSLTHSISVTLGVNSFTTPFFSFNATPASQTVLPGNGTSYALSLTPSGGFAGNVSLSVAGLPAGANATLSTNPVPNGSGTSTLTVTTPSSTAPGNYGLTITGTSPSLSFSNSVGVTLVVNAASTPDFSLSATPASQTVAPGNGTSYALSLTPSNGFAGNVTLSLGPLPAGVNATFNTNPVPKGSGTSTLSVTTASSTPTGAYTITITGTSGSLTKSAIVTLVVNAASTPDFSLSSTPASQTVTQGNGTSYALSLTPSGGFASNVSLSVGALPAGVNATFSTNPVPNGSGTSTLTVTTASSTTPGTYTLTITGTSGSLTHSTSVTLIVRRRRSGG